jgi:hypothetical protein
VLPVNASFRLWGTDACAGVVLLKIANAFIILYDSNTQNYYTIPGEKVNACILYGATNPETIISPSPSSPSPSPSNETLVGIAVGVIVIALVAVVALFVRRRKGAVSRFPLPPPPPPPPS